MTLSSLKHCEPHRISPPVFSKNAPRIQTTTEILPNITSGVDPIPAHITSVVTVNLAAVQANYITLTNLLHSGQCGAVVKANAYGLGVDSIAPALAKAGCTHFFVAHIDEGIQLRAYLPQATIYILSGLLPHSETIVQQHQLIPVLNSFQQLEQWRNLARRLHQPLPTCIHFDTGMARNGFDKNDVQRLLKNTDWFSDIDVRYFFSHLACAEDPDHFMNAQQLQNFQELLALFPQKPICFANSGGIFLGKSYHGDLVRPGKALYGMHPMGDQGLNHENCLQPVIGLKSRIVQVRTVSDKESVGYHCTHTFNRDSRLAILSIGYADGYYRHLSNRGWVHFGDFKAPLVGNVSMDYIIVDVTDIPEQLLIQEGGWAEIIGPHTTPTALTEPANTLAREFLTHLSHRHHWVYTQA